MVKLRVYAESLGSGTIRVKIRYDRNTQVQKYFQPCCWSWVFWDCEISWKIRGSTSNFEKTTHALKLLLQENIETSSPLLLLRLVESIGTDEKIR